MNDDSSLCSHESDGSNSTYNSDEHVINRIERIVFNIISALDRGEVPSFEQLVDERTKERRGLEAITNILMIMSYVQELLQSKKTSTSRELFYFYVTHFSSQAECDRAISDVARILDVPRIAMGIVASPKGWLCGRLKLYHQVQRQNEDDARNTITGGEEDGGNIKVTDCSKLTSMYGLPITCEWLQLVNNRRSDITFESDAKAILVIEKEAIYTRLCEDKFFDRCPCIIITGKGFPDLATRACVAILHRGLDIPCYGVCDLNPYGVGVLKTYFKGSVSLGKEADMYRVPINWLGLRPSQVAELGDDLPEQVFQALTDNDEKQLSSLMSECCEFMDLHEDRRAELYDMQENGYKLELESLQWFGLDFFGNWLFERILEEDVI